MSQYPSSKTLQAFRREIRTQQGWAFLEPEGFDAAFRHELLDGIPAQDQSGFSGDPASWSLALWGGQEMKHRAWSEKRYTGADWLAFNPSPYRATCIVAGCLSTLYVTPGSLGVCYQHVGWMMAGVPMDLRWSPPPSGSPDFQSAAERDAGLAPGQRGAL